MLTTFPTPEEFRQWLQQHEPTTTIAHDWNCYTCPLASFMGKYHVGIDPNDVCEYKHGTWWISVESNKQPLPQWACEFAQTADIQNGTNEENGKPITAADCLRILDEVTNAKDNINK